MYGSNLEVKAECDRYPWRFAKARDPVVVSSAHGSMSLQLWTVLRLPHCESHPRKQHGESDITHLRCLRTLAVRRAVAVRPRTARAPAAAAPAAVPRAPTIHSSPSPTPMGQPLGRPLRITASQYTKKHVHTILMVGSCWEAPRTERVSHVSRMSRSKT